MATNKVKEKSRLKKSTSVTGPGVSSIFITGANRGIGLQLTKQLLGRFKPKVLFATYRKEGNSKELLQLADKNKNLMLMKFDVTDYGKYDSIVKAVDAMTGDAGLNLLINNAGILVSTGLKKTTLEGLRQSMEVNAFAPLMFTKALLPLLEKGTNSGRRRSSRAGINRAAIINISSELGSVKDNDSGGYYAYRLSKSALNSATKTLSVDLKDRKIIAVAIHPGWVQTDMGGSDATLSVEESVAGVMKVLENLNDSHNGKFLQWNGKELPW